MLMIFYGTDRIGVRDAANSEIETLGAVASLIDETTYEAGAVASVVGATSLFGGSECFLVDTPSSSEEFYQEVLAALPDLAASQNTFIVLEQVLLAETKKKYAKHASVIEEFSIEKRERFDTFAIAEALARRDKKQLWVLMMRAKENGLREEEIIGMLWWQLKALRLAKRTDTPVEAGMKEYPYKKAKQSLRYFKDGDVETLARSLLTVYHDAHRGKRDLNLALEEWVLNV
jgi:DNA polymerase III delta subunit